MNGFILEVCIFTCLNSLINCYAWLELDMDSLYVLIINCANFIDL